MDIDKVAAEAFSAEEEARRRKEWEDGYFAVAHNQRQATLERAQSTFEEALRIHTEVTSIGEMTECMARRIGLMWAVLGFVSIVILVWVCVANLKMVMTIFFDEETED